MLNAKECISAQKSIIPKTICFRLTRKCNMNCPFCQAPPDHSKDFSIREVEGIIDIFHDLNLESIKFTGGEPCIYPNLDHIILYCRNKSILPVLCTNATLLTQRNMDVLAETQSKVKVSLHGFAEIHDLLVDSRVGHIVIENIEKMLKKGITVSLHTIVSKINIDTFEPFLRYAMHIGIKKVSLIAFVPRGRFADNNENLVTVEQLKEHRDYLKGIFGQALDLRVLDFSRPYYVLESDGSLWIQRDCEQEDHLLSKNIFLDRHKFTTDELS